MGAGPCHSNQEDEENGSGEKEGDGPDEVKIDPGAFKSGQLECFVEKE